MTEIDTTDEEAATSAETRAFLLTRNKRDFTPIAQAFVQTPRGKSGSRRGPLATFVNNGDLRGLQAFLLTRGFAASGENGWSTTLHLDVWARAIGTTETADAASAKSAASKVLSRLVVRKLIVRERGGTARKTTVTLLADDGSGDAYHRAKGVDPGDRFLKLPHEYWHEGWYARLDLPATAMLLVALHEKPTFELATEHMPEWYGWSADTAERGLQTLVRLGALTRTTRRKKAPLAPGGVTEVNVYHRQAPFLPGLPSPNLSHQPKTSAASSPKKTKKQQKKKTTKRTVS